MQYQAIGIHECNYNAAMLSRESVIQESTARITKTRHRENLLGKRTSKSRKGATLQATHKSRAQPVLQYPTKCTLKRTQGQGAMSDLRHAAVSQDGQKGGTRCLRDSLINAQLPKGKGHRGGQRCVDSKHCTRPQSIHVGIVPTPTPHTQAHTQAHT